MHWTMIFPTNQSKHASHNAWTNEISGYKSQLKGFVEIASEHCVNENNISFESFKIFGRNA